MTQDQQTLVKFGLLQDHSAGKIISNLAELLDALTKYTIERRACRPKIGKPLISSNFREHFYFCYTKKGGC